MPWHKLARRIVAAAAAVVLATPRPGSAATAAAPVRAPVRAATGPPDVAETPAVVVAALKDRQHALRNIRYSLRETITRVDHGQGTTKTLHEMVVEFRWSESGHWMHLREYAADGAQTIDHFTNWADGRARSLTLEPGKSNTRGTRGAVRDVENTNFGYRAFNQVLGLRVLRDGPPLSISEWVEGAIAGGKPVTFGAAEVGGVPARTVAVRTSESETKTFSFDPARGWMILRVEYFCGTPKANNYEHTDVQEAKRVGDVWIPVKALRRTGTTVSRGEGVIQYAASDVELGAVTGRDLEAVFPPGTEVVDSVGRTAYRVEASGPPTPLPLYSAATGKVNYPAGASNVPSTLPALALLGGIRPTTAPTAAAGMGPAAFQPVPRGHGALLIGGGIALCAAAAGVALAQRARTRRRGAGVATPSKSA